jgi:hypothetical protein
MPRGWILLIGDVARTIEVETFPARLHMELSARVKRYGKERRRYLRPHRQSPEQNPKRRVKGGKRKLGPFHQNMFIAKLRTSWQS